MIIFTPSTSNELQLTDDQLQIVVGGCGHHERRDNDCDDRRRDSDCGNWNRGDNNGCQRHEDDERASWGFSEWGEFRRHRS